MLIFLSVQNMSRSQLYIHYYFKQTEKVKVFTQNLIHSPSSIFYVVVLNSIQEKNLTFLFWITIK